MPKALRNKLSAFVVTYNRAEMLATCLRGVAFADEVIVIDKSSTDDTPAVATGLADRVLIVPWSPTVEETRAFALGQCSHNWILFLDDDECLSAEAGCFIQSEMQKPRADIYALPLRHYVLGEHDERAYYWPERHVRLFRRGTVEFSSTVHAGLTLHSDRVMQVSPEAGACIHHLSHPDVAGWIERTNRYTSRPDRAPLDGASENLVEFAHARVDYWLERTRDADPSGYPAAVALLRAIYDMVDRLKIWEDIRGKDGNTMFEEVRARLDGGRGVMPPRAASGVSERNVIRPVFPHRRG